MSKQKVVYLTSAPPEYDYSHTRELSPAAAVYNGRVMRKVEIDADYAWYQIQRYGSGLHTVLGIDDLEKHGGKKNG